MTAIRKSSKIDDDSIQISEILDKLLSVTNVLHLRFESTRAQDTQPVTALELSSFSQKDNFKEISCNLIRDEMTYIEAAQLCLFITEGDLRSHTYLPPLLGRNVIVVCSESLRSKVPYVLEWNNSLFTSSGKMYLITPEELTVDKLNRVIIDYGN